MIHPAKKIFSNGLAMNSFLVFSGTMVANIASYVFHLLMGRLLGPNGYGELSSLLSILYIFTIPLVVGQTVLVKYISSFKAHGDISQSKSLFTKVTRLCLIGSVAVLPFAVLLSPAVTKYLHLASPVLFILVYVLFVVTLLSVVAASVLQGYQKFFWFSFFSATAVIVKVLMSVPMAGFGVSGVLWASIISAAIIYLFYFFPLRFILLPEGKPTNINKKEAIRFAAPTLLTLLGITSLYSTDVILVRHFFPSSDAGMYAALAILGKIIFYASSAVSLVMFPVISEKTAKKENTRKLGLSAIAGVSSISAALCLVYMLFPVQTVQMLFGNAYMQAGSHLGQFGIFLGLFSVAYIIANLCLAIGKTGIWIISIVCALLQIAGIQMFHNSIISVIQLNVVICGLFVILALGYYLRVSYEKV